MSLDVPMDDSVYVRHGVCRTSARSWRAPCASRSVSWRSTGWCDTAAVGLPHKRWFVCIDKVCGKRFRVGK
eukprot:33491-Eustigmatos_ZCMA.PRE.1